MKSEYAIWRDEIERPRLSVKERMARWFDRPEWDATPTVNHFVWRLPGEKFPKIEPS